MSEETFGLRCDRESLVHSVSDVSFAQELRPRKIKVVDFYRVPFKSK